MNSEVGVKTVTVTIDKDGTELDLELDDAIVLYQSLSKLFYKPPVEIKPFQTWKADPTGAVLHTHEGAPIHEYSGTAGEYEAKSRVAGSAGDVQLKPSESSAAEEGIWSRIRSRAVGLGR